MFWHLRLCLPGSLFPSGVPFLPLIDLDNRTSAWWGVQIMRCSFLQSPSTRLGARDMSIHGDTNRHIPVHSFWRMWRGVFKRACGQSLHVISVDVNRKYCSYATKIGLSLIRKNRSKVFVSLVLSRLWTKSMVGHWRTTRMEVGAT